MGKALIVGGSSGIGLAISLNLIDRGVKELVILDRKPINIKDAPQKYHQFLNEKVVFVEQNLICPDLSVLDYFSDIDFLIITAGFGRVALFENLSEIEIRNLIRVNYEAGISIIKKYYDNISGLKPFYTAIMVSICGRIVSPFFSVYGSAKAGLRFFIENINCELANNGCNNRILEVSPGSIKGTAFSGGENDIVALQKLADEIVEKMICRETLFIPGKEIYGEIIERYKKDGEQFGKESFEYKLKSGRISNKNQVTIGYLSGTFDLFHIGHLNLLKRAKTQCDYLIVGVHESGSWKGKETFIPLDERMAIVSAIKYVDKVVVSEKEDSDAWLKYKYDKLFVGSDYKGSERFLKYEKFFSDKNVDIVYFPYTSSTSSTQLRSAIKSKISK